MTLRTRGEIVEAVVVVVDLEVVEEDQIDEEDEVEEVEVTEIDRHVENDTLLIDKDALLFTFKDLVMTRIQPQYEYCTTSRKEKIKLRRYKYKNVAA